jgi:hypothetical protein
MLLNNYNGDLAIFDGMRPLIVSYLKAGGNIVMGTRFGESFIGTSGDLYDYTRNRFQSSWSQYPSGRFSGRGYRISRPANNRKP